MYSEQALKLIKLKLHKIVADRRVSDLEETQLRVIVENSG
jgi:hypothetical protein